MPRRKMSTTVYIDADQDDKLHALAERTRVPIAEWIRQGIDLVLAKEHAPPVAIRVTSEPEGT